MYAAVYGLPELRGFLGVLQFLRELPERVRTAVEASPSVIRLMVICFCVWGVQLVTSAVAAAMPGGVLLFGEAFKYTFGLSPSLLLHGFVWQPLTYLFLHAAWWHLLCNMLGLWFVGSSVERVTDSRTVLKIFFIGGFFAAFGWLAYVFAVNGDARELCVGASGGVCALLGAFSALFATRKIYLLVFFVLPIKIKGRWLVWIVLAGTLAEGYFLRGQVAFTAHFTGCLVGWLYGLYIRKRFLYLSEWTQS